MKKHLIGSAAAIALSCALLPAGASAAPTRNTTVDLTCDEGLPSGTIVVPLNEATWTPGMLQAHKGNFIPYEMSSHAEFRPNDGSATIDYGTDEQAKPAPKNKKAHGTCTFSGVEHYETGDLVFEGTVKVFWTAS